METAEITIHGRTVSYDSSKEYGMYKPRDAFSWDYAEMDLRHIVSAMNAMSYEDTVKGVAELKKRAEDQLAAGTPRNLGSPLLRMSPPATDISLVRGNIENVIGFCGDVLKALEN